MLQEITQIFADKFPLKVYLIEWDNENLCIVGEFGTFNTMSSWRVISDGAFITGWIDSTAKSIIEELQNHQLLGISSSGQDFLPDLTFEFANGYKVQIFCSSHYEPWVLRIDGVKTFIPNLSS